MSKTIRLQLLMACLCCVLGARGLAQTNAAPADTNTATQNALLQIQDQLHDAQMAITETRAKDASEAATNTALLTARIQSLEQTVADQRAEQVETARKTQQITLILAAAFAIVGFGALMLVFYFQSRAFSQFAEISARQLALHGGSPLAGELAAGMSGPARATVETSNLRLLTLVEQLEKRVVEMEHSAHGQLPAPAPMPVVKKTNGHHKEPNRVADLLADGQTLLNAEQPENALKLFEEAQTLDEHNTDIFIKRAGALERLHRVDDAIACYNRAIELDKAATMAWLQKGGLYNRLARYDEAMECYERALEAQSNGKE